jgi:hypothetical protein
MEAACTSETSVNFYQTTRCYNPEDSRLRTRRRENLKSYFYQTTRRNNPEDSCLMVAWSTAFIVFWFETFVHVVRGLVVSFQFEFYGNSVQLICGLVEFDSNLVVVLITFTKKLRTDEICGIFGTIQFRIFCLPVSCLKTRVKIHKSIILIVLYGC